MKIANRLDAKLVAAAAVAGAAGVASQANAQIVWSGPVNINIPSTTAGVYLNVVTGVSSTTPAGAVGWDVNPWSSTGLSFFNPTVPVGTFPSAGSYVGTATVPQNLAAGATIGPASGYGSGSGVAGGFQLNSSNNLVGFRFLNEAGGTVHYGWMRLALGGTLQGQPRAIVEYAFEATPGVPIAAGAVPAPGSLALLALGAAGLTGRRRK